MLFLIHEGNKNKYKYTKRGGRCQKIAAASLERKMIVSHKFYFISVIYIFEKLIEMCIQCHEQ